ncbi:HEL288Wp [Eremothecium sinecaudum]|uniref:HEL288Wp n=1 Tax=Eremothecium sinecaudum TaxID=45286 RepID=A0A0X8HT88_9SACH|nr:HEL288Wp [Eremothecium sinecaudum]AMD20993.1 HEL288Wp [Eremothecium sinecaudum]
MLLPDELKSDEKLSNLLLKTSQFQQTLPYWEELLNYLLLKASPLSKAINPELRSLIRSTYQSMLIQFPYAENYHIDYALFEFKLGSVSKMHKIFHSALNEVNSRSLLLWVEYLKLCNEVVMNDKDLFKKYETAEKYIGLHFFSGEFWLMYLEQTKQRCKMQSRYVMLLRKILEIPLYDYSTFYSLWLQCINDIKDISQLKLFAPEHEVSKKLKVDMNLKQRRGIQLQVAKLQLKKITKELYTVVQYQVMEIYNLFESKLTTHYYTSPHTLIKYEEIATWCKYLNYTINTQNIPLIKVTFQRAVTALCHYDIIWLQWAKWLIETEADFVSAKNVLTKGLIMSHRKATIFTRLSHVMIRAAEYAELEAIYDTVLETYNNCSETMDTEMFIDYILVTLFLKTPIIRSRYNTDENRLLVPEQVLDSIMKRLGTVSKDQSQRVLLWLLSQLYQRIPRSVLEENIFKIIIASNWSHFTEHGWFWYEYCQMVWINSTKSYLEKRRYIVNEILPKAANYKVEDVKRGVLKFMDNYSPEDYDAVELLFR